MIAEYPLRCRDPITERGLRTFKAIAARLAVMHPPIYIERFFAPDGNLLPDDAAPNYFSSLQSHDDTLDGINFIADDPQGLIKALDQATDGIGNTIFITMKEDPDHWALKASFAATVGVGYRETWRDADYEPPAAQKDDKSDRKLQMRFSTAGTKVNFTALHCAVDPTSGKCNIHIDVAGFMLQLPKGVSMTPDFYGHLMNELKWKTDFRDWLSGKFENEVAKKIIGEVVRRLSIDFINASNGYAGMERKVNSVRNWNDVLPTIGKILLPIGVTVNVYDTPDFRVDITGRIVDGDASVTVTLGGRF